MQYLYNTYTICEYYSYRVKTMLKYVTLLSIIAAFVLVAPAQVEAHQPYCEYQDLSAGSPWTVPDPAVSYAYYANMYPEADVDYFTFEAEADQSILLQMSIPDIAGQEAFVPMMAVVGPGLCGVGGFGRLVRLSAWDVVSADGGRDYAAFAQLPLRSHTAFAFCFPRLCQDWRANPAGDVGCGCFAPLLC